MFSPATVDASARYPLRMVAIFALAGPGGPAYVGLRSCAVRATTRRPASSRDLTWPGEARPEGGRLPQKRP